MEKPSVKEDRQPTEDRLKEMQSRVRLLEANQDALACSDRYQLPPDEVIFEQMQSETGYRGLFEDRPEADFKECLQRPGMLGLGIYGKDAEKLRGFILLERMPIGGELWEVLQNSLGGTIEASDLTRRQSSDLLKAMDEARQSNRLFCVEELNSSGLATPALMMFAIRQVLPHNSYIVAKIRHSMMIYSQQSSESVSDHSGNNRARAITQNKEIIPFGVVGGRRPFSLPRKLAKSRFAKHCKTDRGATKELMAEACFGVYGGPTTAFFDSMKRMPEQWSVDDLASMTKQWVISRQTFLQGLVASSVIAVVSTGISNWLNDQEDKDGDNNDAGADAVNEAQEVRVEMAVEDGIIKNNEIWLVVDGERQKIEPVVRVTAGSSGKKQVYIVPRIKIKDNAGFIVSKNKLAIGTLRDINNNSVHTAIRNNGSITSRSYDEFLKTIASDDDLIAMLKDELDAPDVEKHKQKLVGHLPDSEKYTQNRYYLRMARFDQYSKAILDDIEKIAE